jgi:hypothetical protein
MVSVALALVALVAVAAFGLVLVLARRLRAVTERVDLFLPVSPAGLPLPGTPVPEFEAVSTGGERVTQGAFGEVERVFAMLSTGCESCLEQIPAFREFGASLTPRPIVVVTGASGHRAPLVAQLRDCAVVIEEPEHGPMAAAFEISDFPTVLLIRDGVIRQAEHGLGALLPSLASADSPARG